MSHLYNSMVLALAVLVLVGAAAAAEPWPPEGWRLPTSADDTGGWVEYRDLFPVPFHVSGDFNGDGLVDHAWILLGQGRNAYGLFVLLGQRRGAARVVKLFSNDGCCGQNHAIALVPPGRQLTVCGQHTDYCRESTPKSVTLKHPEFQFMTLGTASALYYWSPRSSGFRSVGVAD